jgi:hypothetical protein
VEKYVMRPVGLVLKLCGLNGSGKGKLMDRWVNWKVKKLNNSEKRHPTAFCSW